MTILVGVLCGDGAVIASDQQATHGVFGQTTVGLPITKIHILNEETLFALSGPNGLSQQFCNVISADHKNYRNKPYQTAIPTIQKKLREVLDPAFETAKKASTVVGNVVQHEIMSGSILATRFSDGIKLIDISFQANFEYLTEDLPFICHGSGKNNADPLIGYLWSIFFKETKPNLNEAVLMAYWTVQATIALRTDGVGYDTDVCVLSPHGDRKLVARKVSAEELVETREFIQEAESALAGIRGRMRGDTAQAAPPEPPKFGQA